MATELSYPWHQLFQVTGTMLKVWISLRQRSPLSWGWGSQSHCHQSPAGSELEWGPSILGGSNEQSVAMRASMLRMTYSIFRCGMLSDTHSILYLLSKHCACFLGACALTSSVKAVISPVSNEALVQQAWAINIYICLWYVFPVTSNTFQDDCQSEGFTEQFKAPFKTICYQQRHVGRSTCFCCKGIRRRSKNAVPAASYTLNNLAGSSRGNVFAAKSMPTILDSQFKELVRICIIAAWVFLCCSGLNWRKQVKHLNFSIQLSLVKLYLSLPKRVISYLDDTIISSRCTSAHQLGLSAGPRSARKRLQIVEADYFWHQFWSFELPTCLFTIDFVRYEKVRVSFASFLLYAKTSIKFVIAIAGTLLGTLHRTTGMFRRYADLPDQKP